MSTRREPSNQWDDATVRVVSHRLQKIDGATRNGSSSGAAIANRGRSIPQSSARTPGTERNEVLRQVILVDRDIDALRDVAIALRDEFDFHITISGAEAINLLQTAAIDTIVVGQTLYSSTGINVLAEARRHAPHTHRVLLASAAEQSGIARTSNSAAPFRIMQRPCTADKLRELLDAQPTGDPDIDVPIAPLQVPAHRTPTNSHDPADFEHVVLETAPELPRRAKPPLAGNLPIIVYTDNAEFYQAIALALQDRNEVRLCTQLERAVEFAETGQCPLLVTDRAATQVELQRISIALRALDASTLVIAAGPPEVGAALRKFLGTAALHSFLPKPISTPLVRLAIESAKRHYIQSKTPVTDTQELQVATPKVRRPMGSSNSASAPAYFVPNYRADFSVDDFEDAAWKRYAPKIGGAVVALALVAVGSWYGWQWFENRQSVREPTATVLERPEVSMDLQLAQRAFSDGRYAAPNGNNALYYYSQALARDPQNAEAIEGRERTLERVIEHAEKALLDERLDAAAEDIATVRTLQPTNKRLPFLESQLEKTRRQLASARNSTATVATSTSTSTELAKPISSQAQRDQLVSRWIATGRQRLTQDRLLTPENDSAEFYFRQAERVDPDNAAVRQGLRDIGSRLLTSARDAYSRSQLDLAKRRANEALRFGADSAAVERLTADAEAQTNSTTRNNFLRLALQRTRENKLYEPERDSARYYLNQLQRLDSAATETEQATRAFALKLIENAEQAIAQQQLTTAQQLLNEARRMGFSGDEVSALETRLRSARSQPESNKTPSPPVPAPKLVKSVAPRFPEEAKRAGADGWVDVGFRITASGDVTDVAPVSSKASGNFATQFEQAAVAAIRQYKFETRNIDDRQTTQRMVVRVQFKLE